MGLLEFDPAPVTGMNKGPEKRVIDLIGFGLARQPEVVYTREPVLFSESVL
jgi:hypothetical protein